MQICLYVSPCAATRLLGRHLVTLSLHAVTSPSFHSTPLLLSGSCSLHPTACLQPFLRNTSKQFSAAVLPQGLWVYFLHIWQWLPMAAVHSETADWWSGRGRRGATSALYAECLHSRTKWSSQTLPKDSPSSPDLTYSNLPSGSPQRSGGKETMWWWWVGKGASERWD